MCWSLSTQYEIKATALISEERRTFSKKDCSAQNHYSIRQRKWGREKGGLGRGHSRHHQEWLTVIWSYCLSTLLVMRGCTPEAGIWGCRSLTFLPLSFLRNKTPFLVLIVRCSELSNWYNCGQSSYCVCVCVYAMSGSSGRQPGILFLNFGSCCTAPHIMAPLLKVG